MSQALSLSSEIIQYIDYIPIGELRTDTTREIIFNRIATGAAASGRSRGSWSGRPTSILLNDFFEVIRKRPPL